MQKALGTADKTAAQFKKLDAAAEAVEQAFKDGRISVEQYNKAINSISSRRAELESTANAVNKVNLQSREARSQIITLTRSLASGNIESAAYDFLRLADNADKSGDIFRKIIVPLGAVTAGLAAFSLISFKAWEEQRRLEDALLLTSGAAGVSEARFYEIASAIEDSTNATIGQAEDITLALVRTGKFGSQVVQSFGKNIAALQNVTGQSTDELVKDFANLDKNISERAAKLNETWRFLTAAQFENIRALEQRGDVEGAQLAISEALNDKYATAVVERLGTIESAWVKLRKKASEYFDFAKDLAGANGDSDVALLERREYQLEQRLRILERSGGNPDNDKRVQQYRQEIFDLKSLIREQEVIAEEQANQARIESDAIAASQRIQTLKQSADRQARMNAEIDKLREDFKSAREANLDSDEYSQEEESRLVGKIRERYKDPSENTAAKQAETYVKNLELQAASAGKTKEQIELLKATELDLTQAQRDRVEAAVELIQREKERQSQAKDSEQLIGLQIELLRAQGLEMEAASLEFEQRYDELIDRLISRGDTEGLDLVDQIIDLQKLQSQLQEVEKIIDQSLSFQAQQEKSINAQTEAGLISEGEARRRIVDLHKQTYAELEKQKPLLEELAKQPGVVGEAASQALAKLQEQSLKLRETMDLFEATLRNSIQSGLSEVISGLAKGTLDFGEAIQQLAQTVANAIIDLQAQQIAKSLTNSLFNLGEKGAESAADAATSTATATAITAAGSTAATAMGTSITSSGSAAGVALNTGITTGGTSASAAMSTAIISAGAQAAAQMAAAITTAGATSAGASAAASGFSTGGKVTGPGTGTSDSIPANLSNGEFVTRAAVVAQSNALSFLYDFNARGMAALEDWSRVNHSTGGLAGYPAPEMAAPTLGVKDLPSPASAFNSHLENNFQFNLIDDPQRIADALQTKQGMESLTVVMSRNPAKFRSILGVNN